MCVNVNMQMTLEKETEVGENDKNRIENPEH